MNVTWLRKTRTAWWFRFLPLCGVSWEAGKFPGEIEASDVPKKYDSQWVDLRENLQETMKYGISCNFSPKPINWDSLYMEHDYQMICGISRNVYIYSHINGYSKSPSRQLLKVQQISQSWLPYCGLRCLLHHQFGMVKILQCESPVWKLSLFITTIIMVYGSNNHS